MNKNNIQDGFLYVIYIYNNRSNKRHQDAMKRFIWDTYISWSDLFRIIILCLFT